MCNLYAETKGQQAIRELTGAMIDRSGNLPPLPGIFPDYFRADCPQPSRRPGIGYGTLGHANAAQPARGQEE
jgi:hypothetical protein